MNKKEFENFREHREDILIITIVTVNLGQNWSRCKDLSQKNYSNYKCQFSITNKGFRDINSDYYWSYKKVMRIYDGDEVIFDKIKLGTNKKENLG